jgi:hypothetical protein
VCEPKRRPYIGEGGSNVWKGVWDIWNGNPELSGGRSGCREGAPSSPRQYGHGQVA